MPVSEHDGTTAAERVGEAVNKVAVGWVAMAYRCWAGVYILVLKIVCRKAYSGTGVEISCIAIQYIFIYKFILNLINLLVLKYKPGY